MRRIMKSSEIGNPLDYAWNTTMTWKNGRQLETVYLFGDMFISYEYNADGQRISKTVEDVTTEFFYAGDILAGQKTGDNILMWIYDNNGAYIGFTYNGVEYYYVYNLQHDVEAITDATGAIVASYTYGAWGSSISVKNHTTSGVNIAEINPIRYRGYYYDAETNFYYLNSRYYDPGICRFINVDGYVTTGQGLTSFNMFAYCGNNPVNRVDPTGQFWSEIKDFFSDSWNKAKGLFNGVSKVAYYLIHPKELLKQVHYSRNILNNVNITEDELKKSGNQALSSNEDKLHQNNKKNGERNRKYVINEGWFSQEVVFYSDGTVNNTPEDMGTFNVYYGDNEFLNFVVHGLFDVLPYVLWGNSEDDTTMIWDRLGIND